MKAITPNWIVFAGLIAATAFEHYWVWGLLFLYWSLSAIGDTHTRLLMPVAKSEQPILFWSINALWLVFGLWYIAYDMFWRVGMYEVFGIKLYPGY